MGTTAKQALYFHMGPAFHACVERIYFEEAYAKVLFWDQPLVSSYEELLQVAAEKVLECSANLQAPLVLLGHSFGAQIVADILPLVGHRVREVRLLNSPFRSLSVFEAIYETLFPERGGQAWQGLPFANIQALILEAATHADFDKLYWRHEQRRKDYHEISVRLPPLSVPHFLQIYQSFYERQARPVLKGWSGAMEIFYSVDDYLLKHFSESDWAHFYPACRIHVLRGSGHHSHLEDADFCKKFLNF